jgi:hypothetical protein
LFLDRKQVKAAHLLRAGDLTAERRKEVVAAAAEWIASK